MTLNTQQLQYLVEIERTRSISHAAANLYMGQPNLSRILRDMEEALGFPIFERTRKGVRPTEKGAQLLQHARNILREAEFMERLSPNNIRANYFRVCLPRSYGYLAETARFLNGLGGGEQLDVMLRECHPRQALEILGNGSAEVAVIRYALDYQDYFTEQAEQHDLALIPLGQLEYQIVTASIAPLPEEPIPREKLAQWVEIQHRDVFYPQSKADGQRYRVYTVDRLAQLQLLESMPNTYLWAEPLPRELLERYHLRQLPCAEGGTKYQEALAYKPQCAMSQAEKEFAAWIQARGQ